VAFTFASLSKRREHFGKHGAEFGVTNEIDYERRAEAFVTTPKSPEIWECRNPRRNDILRYNHITNEFVVISDVGKIRTYFKPDVTEHTLPRNLDYYLINCVQI
jgi:pyocin large subunit-like protein